MIALWVAYTLLLSALFALIAECLDHAARAAGLATRWIWLCAISASIAVPIVVNAVAPRTFTGIDTELTGVAVSKGPVFDRLFLIAWAAASLVAAVSLVRSALALRRDARTWHDGMLDGVRIREGALVGPAAIGLLRMRIVIPSWVRALDEQSRSLVLLHETEHATARDPLLVAAAMLALVATPWNAALWWQVRRMRLAIEMDCDQRVLKRAPDARAYALVLLASGERLSSPSLALPLSLATSRRSLEPRILAMTIRHSLRRRVAVCAAACVGALIAIVVACDAPHPDPVSPPFAAATRDLASDSVVSVLVYALGRDGRALRSGDSSDTLRANLVEYTKLTVRRRIGPPPDGER